MRWIETAAASATSRAATAATAVTAVMVLMVVLGAAGCSGASTGGEPPAPASAGAGAAGGDAAERELLRKIDVAIGEAPCTTDSQCASLPIGAKACGGPQSWRPYSSASVGIEEDALKRWAAELAERQRVRQRDAGMMSDCAVVADPGAVCRVGRCVAGGGVRSPAAR